MYDNQNIFAKILRKEISCDTIYEDNKVLFFNDIKPQAKIHILAIPKLAVVDFADFILRASEKDVCNFFTKINYIVEKVKIKNSGFKLISNNGTNSGQEVPHFHVHILGGGNLSKIR